MTLPRCYQLVGYLLGSVVALCPAAKSQQDAVSVSTVVVYSDHDKPLVAKVMMLLADGHTTQRLGDTRLPKGMLTLQPPTKCGRGAQLEVSASAGLYMDTTVQCDSRVVVQLRSNWVTESLLKQSDVAAKSGDYGLAALAASGAAAQLASIPHSGLVNTLAHLNNEPSPAHSDLASALRDELTARDNPTQRVSNKTVMQQAWASAGQFFGVPVAITFEPSTFQPEMTTGLRDAITDFQQSKQLPASGDLDASTLAIMAASSRNRNDKIPILTAVPPESFAGAAPPARLGCPSLLWRMASIPDGTVYGLAYYDDLSGLSTIAGRVNAEGQFDVALNRSEIGEGPLGIVHATRAALGQMTVVVAGEGCAAATLILHPTTNLNLVVPPLH
jgi:putative peptidoglycan binding protein